jgi:2-keto-4-pentenoate hydratase
MPDAVPRLAAALLEARRAGRPLADPPAIADADEAYAVQRIVASRLGALAGWKVGARGPNAPITCAPLFRAALHPDGAGLPRDAFRLWRIESELVLRLRADLPPGGAPFDRARVEAAIGEVLAGFEIVDSRYAAWPDLLPAMLLADGQSHGAMVIGSGVPFTLGLDLAHVPVRLAFDGRTVAQAIGGNPAGDPVALLQRLANHVDATGAGLRAGDIVATGSCTGMIELPAGSPAEAAFEGIGGVSVTRER